LRQGDTGQRGGRSKRKANSKKKKRSHRRKNLPFHLFLFRTTDGPVAKAREPPKKREKKLKRYGHGPLPPKDKTPEKSHRQGNKKKCRGM